MAYKIDKNKCEACAACIETCPNDAIKMVGTAAVIDPELCLDCGACESACSTMAISAE